MNIYNLEIYISTNFNSKKVTLILFFFFKFNNREFKVFYITYTFSQCNLLYNLYVFFVAHTILICNFYVSSMQLSLVFNYIIIYCCERKICHVARGLEREKKFADIDHMDSSLFERSLLFVIYILYHLFL